MTSSHNIHYINFLSLSNSTVVLLVFILHVPLKVNLEVRLRYVDTESMLSVLGIENDGVLGVLSDVPCVDHLRQQFSGSLVVHCLLLCPLHACSQALQLLHILCQLLSFEGLFLLFLLYLGPGSSTLALLLQHIGTLATSHYA